MAFFNLRHIVKRQYKYYQYVINLKKIGRFSYSPYLAETIIQLPTRMTFNARKKYDRPIVKLYEPDDSYKIQPLPAPTGHYPYRLNIEKLAEVPKDKFSFNMVGDTGGIDNPDGQKKIAEQMCKQISHNDTAGQPAFLYHLGDVVYHFGEAEQYDRQFFTPYKHYNRPIFAIAGNHDTDVNPASKKPYKSLDAFSAVFCDTVNRDIPFNKSKARKSMVQPNIYWTLQTPLANIIGLHSNASKYGYIGNDQREWFIDELKAAAKERPDKAIIVCVHHAPYTADFNHGSSIPMITVLENAFKESNVRPDIIFSGHVHNYQRFDKTYTDGKILPFVVCGAGGFDELHPLVYEGDPLYTTNNPLLNNVKLQNYCDSQYGFLKITLEKTTAGVGLKGQYFALNDNGDPEPSCMDSFSYAF